MAYTATTWRWPDSTFGPQKQVPFNNNQQYPDCGPSIRVYTMENILYGLEEVITPLLESIEAAITAGGADVQDTSAILAADPTPTALPSAPCIGVTLINVSTNTEPFDIVVNSGASIKLEVGYSMYVNIRNANSIQVSQASAAENLMYIVSAV